MRVFSSLHLNSKKGIEFRALKIITEAYRIAVDEDRDEMRRRRIARTREWWWWGRREKEKGTIRTHTDAQQGMKWNSNVVCRRISLLLDHPSTKTIRWWRRPIVARSREGPGCIHLWFLSSHSISATIDFPHLNYRFFRQTRTKHFILLTQELILTTD